MTNRNGQTAGQVRRITGVSCPQLRHWERVGLIKPIIEQHLSRGWRVYSPAEVARIDRIMELLDVGWTLRGAARMTDAELEAIQPSAVITPGAEEASTAAVA